MLTKLARGTLSERAASQLVEFIQAEMTPGDVLPAEARLAERLGVSRPIVREALKSLQGQGIVEVMNGKGAVVRSLSNGILTSYFSRAIQINQASILELMDVRRGLEFESARLAAQHRSEEQLEQMQSIVRQMQSALDDPQTYSELDVQLHILIAQASQNKVLVHLVESLREALREASLSGLQHRRTRGELVRVQELHEMLVRHIGKKDIKQAARTMALHMDEAIAALGHMG